MRVCTVCRHAQRAEIDRALVDSETYRNVAEHYGVSASALFRHRGHLSQNLVKAAKVTEQQNVTALVTRVQEKEVIEFRSARDLLGRLGDLEAETRSILAEARSATTQVPCSKCGATVEIRTGSNDTALRRSLGSRANQAGRRHHRRFKNETIGRGPDDPFVPGSQH